MHVGKKLQNKNKRRQIAVACIHEFSRKKIPSLNAFDLFDIINLLQAACVWFGWWSCKSIQQSSTCQMYVHVNKQL